jgi:S1-C subfamily serine protease
MSRLSLLVAICLGGACWAADDASSVMRLRDTDRIVAAKMLAAYVFVANGSGVVVSPDGYILTNHHVIDGEYRLHARFANGESYPAKLVGTDPVGDIALLKITADHPLSFAPLGTADHLSVGMEVIAIGNPFGLGDLDSTPTLTRGILSSSRIVRDDYTDAVQVDAPVNPGNSGGPSFDTDGRVLGINGQIRTLSGMRINSGVGLAISCTQLAAFLPLLEKADGGYVHHTALPKGYTLEDHATGILINGPEEALIKNGDRLISIAGRKVPSLAAAKGLFESLPYLRDCTIPITVVRGDATLEIALPAGRRSIPGKPYHGLSVDQEDDRVIIEQIDDHSPAQEAQIKQGEVLLEANGKAIKRKLDLLKVLVKLEIGDWLELKLRDTTGAERTIKVLLRYGD